MDIVKVCMDLRPTCDITLIFSAVKEFQVSITCILLNSSLGAVLAELMVNDIRSHLEIN